MIAGDGGAPAVKSRTGRSRRWARGWLASMVSTVGAAQKWVASPRSKIPQTRSGSTAGMHTAAAPTAAPAQVKHQPLQWNIGRVQR